MKELVQFAYIEKWDTDDIKVEKKIVFWDLFIYLYYSTTESGKVF
jgi:hypothetical protein